MQPAYSAHAAVGRDKPSGIERETHKMMLDHHQRRVVVSQDALVGNRSAASLAIKSARPHRTSNSGNRGSKNRIL
jgi:hypothetical protein